MNLEQFPTSDTAKRMMNNITGNGFYDNSYVGKWIFQVMGIEMDEARKIVEELPKQAFPETATWGLRYHEQKYGLPVKENLPDEERRRIILEKRNLKAPMTPWRMEIILKDLLGCNVAIEDINDSENAIEHPNKFIVHLEGDGEFSLEKAVGKVDAIKQSHTFYELRVRLAIFVLVERFFLKSTIRTKLSWWGSVFPAMDGKHNLDGGIRMNARQPPFFVPMFKVITLHSEKILLLSIKHRIPSIGTYGKITNIINYRMDFYWNDGQVRLNGEYSMDGELNLSNGSAPYLASISHRAKVKHDEEFNMSIYKPSDDIRMNGTYFLNGNKKLNSGREVL